MAGMRVHELAKEFGMSSKELLEKLAEMKIPAKNHASTLVDAYVDKIRKQLGPELEAKAAAEKAAQDEAARKAAEEAERIEREKREAEEAAAKAAEEEARRAAEAAELARREEERKVREAALEEERKAKEAEEAAAKAAEEEAKAAKRAKSQFGSLLDQIEAEQKRLEEDAAAHVQEPELTLEPEEKVTSAPAEAHTERQRHYTNASQPKLSKSEVEAAKAAKNAKKAAKRKGGKGGSEVHDMGEDRYSQMAKEAERFQRSRVLQEAHAAVEAQAEGEGRRRKRKAKRAAEKKAAEEAAREEAILRGETVLDEGTVKVPTGSTVAEFSELLGVPSNDVIKRLFLLGSPLTLTQSMSDDLIELIADDMGRSIHISTPEEEESFTFYDEPKDLKPRPPVVTVMGHVDHGKTSLLDAIRETGVVATEAGGITQHIGASVVHINDRQITFIDTPGHETFTAMRARGAKMTDVVVLVVAADDGVMPQTIESINHSKAAGVPIVVAVNKIDKPDADPSRARQELTAYGVIDEAWGGDTMFVDVSAKKRIGIDDLLETILLQSDVLELKANPDTFASGNIIEAKLDRGRGPVATVLVTRGTLHVGDAVCAGVCHGRVRAMIDPKGNNVDHAGPADPVEILGLSAVPDAGDEFRVFEDERDARTLADERALRRRLAAQQRTRMSLDDLYARMSEGETTQLNLVVKADVQGSIEALQDALDKMDQSEVKIDVIHSAVGGITETDVTLAAASDAIIVGFNVRPQAKAKAAAEKEKVDIRTYRVIYEAIDEINAARVGKLSPDIVEVDTASLEVRDLFKVPKVGTIAGCYVTDGEIDRDDKIRLVRDGTVVFEGTIASLRRFKDDVKTVKNGYECGLGIDGYQDVHVGDVIESYRIEEVARTE